MALPLFASILLGTVAQKVVPAFATKKLGMDPKAAAFLGMAAGFGAGAVGSGAFSAGSGFGSLGSSAGAASATSAAGGASSLSSAFGGGASGNALTNWIGNQFPMSNFGSGVAASGFKSTIAPNLSSSMMGSAYTPAAVNAQVMGLTPSLSTGQLNHPLYKSVVVKPPSVWDPRYAFRTANASGMGGAGQPLGYNAPTDLTLGPSTWDKLKAYAKSEDSQRFLGNAASTLIEGMMQEKPQPRITGGGGGGGGGGRMAPAYPGGGGGQQTQVVWGFGGNGQGGFNPQPIT